MMVSKIAVMALVGILAVPILLGYAMNLSEVQVSDYNPSGDAVNVSPLLETGTSYTYAHATAYELNTKFGVYSNKNVLPVYESIDQTKSSFGLNHRDPTNTYVTIGRAFYVFSMLYFNVDYSSTDYLILKVYDNSNNVVKTVNRIYSLYYDAPSQKIDYFYYDASMNAYHATWDVPSINYIPVLTDSGSFTGHMYYMWTYSGRDDGSGFPYTQADYVNLAAGFRLYDDHSYIYQKVLLPNYTRSALFTIDLSTITQSSYSMIFGGDWKLIKTTDGGGNVSWVVYDDLTSETTELYYDQSRSSNTYQLKVWTDTNTATPTGTPGYYYYDRHFEYRYVGDWPTLIGEANYYQKYDIVRNIVSTSEPNFSGFSVQGLDGMTPVMRVDDAEYRAFMYQVIENQTYNPAAFKTNPATTISNLQIYGSTIEFGGNSYTVKNGSITLGSHQISLNGMTFDSVPSSSGSGYDNRINKTVISTTVDPSTITFNGKWAVIVVTDSLDETTTTKTEWTAGQFGWNGLDQNFLMVGLLTSVGAFIALGIYARRAKASIWPLLLVCGGAAMLFFVML